MSNSGLHTSFNVNNINVDNIESKDQNKTGFGSLHWGRDNQVSYAKTDAKYGFIPGLFITIGLTLGILKEVTINQTFANPLKIRVWDSDAQKLLKDGIIDRIDNMFRDASVHFNTYTWGQIAAKGSSSTTLPKENLKKYASLLKEPGIWKPFKEGHTFHNKLFLGESERQGKSILSDGNNFFEIESKQLTQFLSSNDDKKIPCKKITKDTPFIPLGSEKAISAYLETPGTLSIRLDSNNDPILTFTPGEENFGEEFNETTL